MFSGDSASQVLDRGHSSAATSSLSGLRGVVVGSDGLAVGLLCGFLSTYGLVCASPRAVDGASALVEHHDPHVILVDLDGPHARQLHEWLVSFSRRRPYVALLALSGHWSPELGWASQGEAEELLGSALYVPKAALSRPGDLGELVSLALSGATGVARSPRPDLLPLSPTQAEVLRLVSCGLSNAEIARSRGTSVRAVEAMLRRVFASANARADGTVSRVTVSRRVWQHEAYVTRKSYAKKRSPALRPPA